MGLLPFLYIYSSGLTNRFLIHTNLICCITPTNSLLSVRHLVICANHVVQIRKVTGHPTTHSEDKCQYKSTKVYKIPQLMHMLSDKSIDYVSLAYKFVLFRLIPAFPYVIFLLYTKAFVTICFNDFFIDCRSNPCQHGRCTSTSTGYHCSCHTGYTGRYCQTGIRTYL